MRTFLPARGPLDFELSCYRYHVWGEDLANGYRDGRFRRITEHAGVLWLYEVQDADAESAPGVQVRVLACSEEQAMARDSSAGLPTGDADQEIGATHHIREEVTCLFSLEEDLEAFYRFAAARDATLDTLCRALRGYRVTRAANLFEALVTSITAQQINLPFAFKVRNRLIREYGRTLSYEGETHYAFPEPAAIAAASPETLRAMQFSTRKAEYIIGLARAMASGEIVESELQALPDEEVVQRLCRQPGIGRWTAEWALIRAFGRNDVLPADDLGVQHAAGRYYGGGRRATATEVRRLGEPWHPWESWATYYLLAGLRLDPEKVSDSAG